jgi:hypothetical protein
MKNFKMLILLAAMIVAISACNTENPLTSSNDGSSQTPMFVDNWNPTTVGGCDYYHRDRENGGPKGYQIVVADRSIFGTIILCRQPGDSYCPETTISLSPANGIPTNDMLNASHFAYHQIVTGNLSGMISFPETGLSVKWSSTSKDTVLATSSVHVWETSGTDPK